MRDGLVHAAQGACLLASVAAQALCALGLRLAPRPFDRLHLQAPAALLGPTLIALALSLRPPSAPAVLKAWLAAGFLACANPLACYYTAQALLARKRGPAGDRDPNAMEAA